MLGSEQPSFRVQYSYLPSMELMAPARLTLSSLCPPKPGRRWTWLGQIRPSHFPCFAWKLPGTGFALACPVGLFVSKCKKRARCCCRGRGGEAGLSGDALLDVDTGGTIRECMSAMELMRLRPSPAASASTRLGLRSGSVAEAFRQSAFPTSSCQRWLPYQRIVLPEPTWRIGDLR